MIENVFFMCIAIVGVSLFCLLVGLMEKIDEKQEERKLAEKIKAEKIRERTRI